MFSHCRRAFSTKAFVSQITTLYRARNPTYDNVVGALKNSNVFVPPFETRTNVESLPNDHMALRTLCMPERGLGLQYLDRFFQQMCYLPRDEYVFTEKKLRARWYAPSSYLNRYDCGASLPRIFISELCVDQLSLQSQSIFQRYIARQSAIARFLDEQELADKQKSVAEAVSAVDNKLYDKVPTLQDFVALQKETEYGAWTLLNGHRINHCTIATSLFRNPFEKLHLFVPYARQQLNVSFVGSVNESADGKLLQISTEPAQGEFLFADQSEPTTINGSFVEIIERGRDGFEAGNADRIFETTNQRQR